MEFKVIVLAAGRGSRFLELTDRKPKCLLPIGNHPMVYYPLKLIENSGFKGKFIGKSFCKVSVTHYYVGVCYSELF